MLTEVMWLRFHQLLLFALFVKFGDSAITIAADQGHFDIAELLLKSKVLVLLS
jgi:ankyrin repeat protein